MSITDDAIHRAQNQASKNTDGPRLAYVEAPADEHTQKPATLKWPLFAGVGVLACSLAAATLWIQFFNGREALIHMLGGAVETPAIAQSEAPTEPTADAPVAATPTPEKVTPPLPAETLASTPAQPDPVPTALQGTRKGVVLDFTQQDAKPVAAKEPVPEPVPSEPAKSSAPAEAAAPSKPVVTTKIKALDTDEIQVIPLDPEPATQPDPAEATATAEEARIQSFIDSLDIGDAQKIGSSWVVRVNGRYVAESTVIDRERLLAVRSISTEAILISDAKGRLYPVQIQ